jgi:plasmid stabilization system protein ParE
MIETTFTLRALSDIERARDWYDQRHAELGARFVEATHAAVMSAATLLERAQEVHAGVRAIRMKRFPYRVYYRCEPEQIIILAVYHTARDPQRWDESDRT